MKKVLFFLFLSFSFGKVYCQIPQQNLIFWVNGNNIDTLNGRLVQWPDISGANNNAIQNTVGRRPYVNVTSYDWGGKSTIDFRRPEVNFLTTLSPVLSSGDFSIFIVFKADNTNILMDLMGQYQISAPGRTVWAVNKLGQPNFLIGGGINFNVPNQGYSLISIINEDVSGGHKTFINSILKHSGTFSDILETNLTIGTRSTNYLSASLDGEIAEIIIYEEELNNQERVQVENYLMNKFAPPVNFSSDLNIPYGFCDTTISSPNYYTSYLWSTGETDSSIIVNDPGEYWLEGIDIFGRVSRDTIEIIRPAYNDIQLQNQLICFNESDTITANLPQGNYTFIQWSDGNINPTRILDQNESISFAVIDSLGCTGFSNTAVVSIDNSLESISLGMDTSLCSGNSIQLIQSSTNITNWLWNIQDTGSTISIDTSGTYILDVINDNGCENSDTIEVTVIGTAPSLSYSIENEICQGSEFNFSESSTVPPGNNISEVIWNFGELDSVFLSSEHKYMWIRDLHWIPGSFHFRRVLE